MTAPAAVFILNPAAGHGRAEKTWNRRRDRMLAAMPGSVCLRTESAGHAAALAKDAVLRGAAKLIAVGGDGTFHEVLQGVMQAPLPLRRGAALGLLPAGSGCDLARHLDYPADADGLARVLASGTRRLMDVGRIRYQGLDGSARERYFINIAAFGLAGDVAHDMLRVGKPLGGTVSYFLCSVKALMGARAKPMRLNTDGQEISGRYHLAVLANTSSMGGGMKIAPGARDDDGELDLVTVADMGRLKLLRSFPRIYAGTHLSVAGVVHRRVRKLEADSSEEVLLNIDGEAEGRLPASFELLPRAVTVLVPNHQQVKDHG